MSYKYNDKTGINAKDPCIAKQIKCRWWRGGGGSKKYCHRPIENILPGSYRHVTALFTTNKGDVSNMRYHFVHGTICINSHGKDIKALLSCLHKFVFMSYAG